MVIPAAILDVSRMIVAIIVTIISSHPTIAFDAGSCNEPLGMESGAILDDAISASSSYVPNVGARNGRLRVEKAGGGWCPKQQVERGIREYIQVDFQTVHVISGVQTQGRYDRGRGQEYTEEYTVEYWRPGLQEWRQYRRWDNKEVLRGNSDTSSVESHRLLPSIFATKIRILPYSLHRRTVCLRIELLGCAYEGNIISYSIPDTPEPSQGLSDASYDGIHTENDRLVGGLGRLVDGETGGDNFRIDIGYGKGNGWVGWRNDTFPVGYIEVIFEFQQVRNFSAVHMFTNNYFSRGVQIFSTAKVQFSIGGRHYNGPMLTYNFPGDRLMEAARNVTIPLHHRLARFIKFRLYFADRWILLGEFNFDSVATMFNVSDEESADTEQQELVVMDSGVTDNDSNSNRNNVGDAEEIAKTFETTARKDGNGYVEVVIGALTALVLLFMMVFVVVVLISRRHKLHGSPTYLRNPFGLTLNIKEFLWSLSGTNQQLEEGEHSNPPAAAGITPLPLEAYEPPPILNGNLNGGNGCYGTIGQYKSVPTTAPTYRSLQSTPATQQKGNNCMDFEGYFPCEAANTEPPNRKRYHRSNGSAPTTSRHNKKHHSRVAPPVIYWNLAPSMTHSYNKCVEVVELTPIPCYALRPLEKIGACHAGEITLYETTADLEDIIPGVCRIVVVRTQPPNRSIEDETYSREYLREVRFLAGLVDPNLCRVLGVCTAESPGWTVLEYGDMGDLCQYLQFLVKRNESTTDPPLSTGNLLYMISQIASGMKYLEEKHVVHKDLAARNCLVGRGCVIKIADVAMVKPQYRQDYTEIGGRTPAPIRWLPWESILLDRYSCSSGVWSYGITIWEIFGFCCERPFANLTNDKVIQNAEHMYYGGELQVMLNKPTMCAPEMYALLNQCWRRDDTDRPTFHEICNFLEQFSEMANTPLNND